MATEKTEDGGARPRKTLASDAELVVPMNTGRHLYIVVYAKTMCDTYLLNDEVELVVNEPPPQYVVLQNGGECRGTIFMLVE